MISLDALSPLKSIQFVAFDFETTGLDPQRDKIIEIGMTLFQRDKILQTFHELVDPGIPMPREVSAIHGITDEMLRGKPSIQKFLPAILDFLGRGIPMAHNASFDFAFLSEAARAEGLTIPQSPMVDTCRLAQTLFPELPKHKLVFLVERFGIQTEKSHRALADSQSCFSVFCKSVEKLPLQWETSWRELQSHLSGILSLEEAGLSLPENLLPLQKALQEHQRLKISYKDGKGVVTERELSPSGFTYDGRRMVLIAYCHLRQSTRTFRLDRILGVL